MATSTGATLEAVAVTAIPADKAAYDALTYVKVGNVGTIGPLGDSDERITFAQLESGFVESVHGTKDPGELPVSIVTEAVADAGQVIINTAANGRSLIACKIIDADSSFVYFTARVANVMQSERSPSIQRGLTFSLWRQDSVSGPHTS